MSPRRSSRARIAQPTPGVTTAHSTSSSSVSSARTERATRSHKSPQKSSTPHSLSSEEPEGSQVEPPLTRRRTREQDNDEEESTKFEDDLDDDVAEEEEITRCVCGQLEYPGPPSDTGKSRDGQPASLTDSDVQNDEAGGLFIQCDICKVWQHGGCVGIMDEAASPDEYFCEDCRKDLHKVMTSSKGQRYSRYLPLYDQSHAKNVRKGSVSKETESKVTKDKDRNSRASAESFSKRRSTMNSRAAYDEDEVLRKVLEESKNEGPASENGNRKKRGRDDSEEIKQETKRQRTSSRSQSNSPVVESEEENLKVSAAKQKPRGAAARSQREKELRDKELERMRTEAANRRKGRAERRKGEELETPEILPSEEPASAADASETAAPDTPTTELKPPPVQRKSGRPPQKRGGRLGRSHLPRDAPTPATNGASPAPQNDVPNSPRISVTNGVSNGHESSDGAVGSKPTKTKNWRLEKLSWNDIRRPASVMQNYITQRQVELAGQNSSPAPAVQTPTPATADQAQQNVEQPKDEESFDVFKKLSTLQMMDDLSRDLVHWQRMVTEQVEK